MSDASASRRLDPGVRTGLFFGLTSGVITTLGLIIGLHSGTGSLVVVLDGIVVIALADSLSDALGVHLSQEAVPGNRPRTVWRATFTTFFAKLGIALSFLLPVLLLDEGTAIIAATVWGFTVLAALSLSLARAQRVRALPVIAEHLAIGAAVVLAAHLVGDWAHALFS